MGFDPQIQVVRILIRRSHVVQPLRRIVVPPFTVDINQISLPFKEIGMVFRFPLVGGIKPNGFVPCIPTRNRPAVGTEGCHIQNGDGSDRIYSTSQQSTVGTCDGTRIRKPTIGIRVV